MDLGHFAQEIRSYYTVHRDELHREVNEIKSKDTHDLVKRNAFSITDLVCSSLITSFHHSLIMLPSLHT